MECGGGGELDELERWWGIASGEWGVANFGQVSKERSDWKLSGKI